MKLTKSAVALSALRAQTQISIKEWSTPTVEYYSAVKRARSLTWRIPNALWVWKGAENTGLWCIESPVVVESRKDKVLETESGHQRVEEQRRQEGHSQCD